MEESVGGEDLEFKWGKKRRTGGKNKDVQFYESFTYDGDEYNLFDCVLVEDPRQPDSGEFFIGKIIKIWERGNKGAKCPRQVKLLWFFKPSEISSYLEEVPDVLPNELFLASGEGVGVANINAVESIGGKCSVLCISKDKRNPQPSDEEIKSTNFVFRRTFDVGSRKVLDTLDDNIAKVDVKFIFNRAGCEKDATAVPKVEAGINGNLDSLKPNGPSASGSVRKIEDNSVKSSDYRESSYGCKEEKEKGHIQVATKKSTVAEENSNKDSRVQEGTTRNEHDSCKASGSKGNHCDGKAEEKEVKKQFTKQKSLPAEERYSNSCEASGSKGNHCDGKAQEKEVQKQFAKQKSMPAEERYSNSCEASGSGINHSNTKIDQVNGVRQLTKQKSMPNEGRHSKESNGLDESPLKKQKLNGSVTVPNGRNTNTLKNISSDGKKDTGSFKRPRDKVTRDEVLPEKPSFVKKQDLGVSVSEGKDPKIATEKVLSKKPSFDGKLLKRSGEKRVADDNERNYQVTEVTQKPDAVNSKWFRPLPWEESMREAETQERLVLLQNLDPTYTSHEVQDIVYSALNEQCTARMIENIPLNPPHIGQALVIFESREAAQRAVRRLDEGCLLLSDGRPLIASFAKINPPGKPSSLPGHIKLHKIQMRRETREAKATSHCSQGNTLEYELAMEWCLHQARSKHSIETVFKRQSEEYKSMRINFKPKLP